MLRKFITLMAACICVMAAQAVSITDHAVYQIVCAGTPDQVATARAFGQCVITEKPVADDKAQLWQFIASGTGYYVRNLNSGAYLYGSNATSSQWFAMDSTTPDDAHCLMEVADRDGNVTIRPIGSGSYHYMHMDGGHSCVGWEPSNPNSQWTLSLADISANEADEMVAEAEALWAMDVDVLQAHLDAIFADKACTTLNSTYTAMNEYAITADEHYRALPDALKQMVLKVLRNDWSETTDDGVTWDDAHARKFRLQSYEPYSRGDEVCSGLLKIQAYTNMNNPTGILANNRSNIFVMVNDPVPDGATLRIAAVPDENMYNDWNAGYELHQGVNSIPAWSDNSIFYIYYTVDTYSDGQRRHKLAEFSPINIHIEGGRINGFFNYLGDELYTPDTNQDWFYYRERATHPMFDLVGRLVILHFFLEDCDGASCLKSVLAPSVTFDLPTILTAWDDMCLEERLLMGLQPADDITSAKSLGFYDTLEGDDIAPADLWEYFNNRMMGITMHGNLYMNATTWRTAYHASTMESILIGLPNNAGSLWGPAHEYGHMNQIPMKIAGTTEISNNIFSNVAVYYQGITTSRAAMPSDQQQVFNKGLTFLENGTWGTTRMFWQLWLYYHVVGHNRKFYPRLYQLLRENPLQKSGYELDSRYDLLHFAKMCCMAAGEDLTDFFTAWGFFVVQDDYFIDDYSRWNSHLSQADIDAVKQEIADYGYPKNSAIIFIDDRIGSDRESFDGFPKENAGTMGSIRDFIDGNTATGDYIIDLTGNSASVSGGNGGVGYAIYDVDGNLIAFGNDSNFTVSNEAAKAIAQGNARVEVVNADGSTQVVADIMEAGTDEQKRAKFDQLMATVRDFLDNKVDPTGTRVGFYRGDRCQTLSEVYDLFADNETLHVEHAYSELARLYYDRLDDKYGRIAIQTGNTYAIRNASQTQAGRPISNDGSNIKPLSASEADDNDPTQRWKFVEGPNANTYGIYNEAISKYIGKTNSNYTSIPLSDDLQSYTLREQGVGIYTLNADNGEWHSLHIDGSNRIVRWETSPAESKWYITCVGVDEDNDAKVRLEQLISETEELLDEMGTFSHEHVAMPITESHLYSNAPHTGAGNDQFTSWSVLLDDNINTYFHSNWANGQGTADGLEHYIRIQIPDEVETPTRVSLSLTTRNGNADAIYAPKEVKLETSATADNDNWTEVAHITSGIPDTKATDHTTEAYEVPADTKYVRMRVLSNNFDRTTSDNFAYFVLSGLKLNSVNPGGQPKAKYTDATPEMLDQAYNQAIRARQVLAAAVPEGSTAGSTYGKAYDDLYDKYATLLNAREVSTAITEVTVDSDPGNSSAAPSTPVIYNLQGRRLTHIPGPGLYIINGQKTLIR